MKNRNEKNIFSRLETKSVNILQFSKTVSTSK